MWYCLSFSFYRKYDISVKCRKPRKYFIYVERFYENVAFHAVSLVVDKISNNNCYELNKMRIQSL